MSHRPEDLEITPEMLLELARVDTRQHTLSQLRNLAKLLGLQGFWKLDKFSLHWVVIERQEQVIRKAAGVPATPSQWFRTRPEAGS